MANYTPVSVLDLTFSDLYQKGYSVAEPWSEAVATTMPTKGSEVLIGWLDKIPSMRKWVGNRVMNHANIRTYSIVNDKWEGSVAMDRSHVEDNQLGLYAQAIIMLGQNAKKWRDRIQALKIKENPVGFDGVPFYSASHPVDLDNPGLVYSNVVTDATSMEDAYQKAVALGATFVGADGENMDFTITHVVVAGGQKIQMMRLLNTAFAPVAGTGGNTNIFQGIATGVVAAELALTAAEQDALGALKFYVYFLDLSKGISPWVFSERDVPELQMLGTEGAYTPKTDLYEYGYRARGNAAVSLPFLSIRATVTPA